MYRGKSVSLKAEMDPAKRRKRRVTSKRDVSELLLRDSVTDAVFLLSLIFYFKHHVTVRHFT